jgi:hypothetical protein
MATQTAYSQVADASAVSPKPSPNKPTPQAIMVALSARPSQAPVTGWTATITIPLTAMASP